MLADLAKDTAELKKIMNSHSDKPGPVKAETVERIYKPDRTDQ
jgi:hypothetical protein